MIFHDVEQNSDEWLFLRAGKITGSEIGKIMANEGKAFGKPAKDYAIKIALERLTGKPINGGYSNFHMERGHEQEPLARLLYEEEYFCDVSNGGFFDAGSIGCSPDGLVFDDGVIEIKSSIYSVHYAREKRNDIDPAYKWQSVFNLKVTGRKWLDFISYCHEYPKGRKLFVKRLHQGMCKDLFKRVDKRLSEFEEVIAEISKEIAA